MIAHDVLAIDEQDQGEILTQIEARSEIPKAEE